MRRANLVDRGAPRLALLLILPAAAACSGLRGGTPVDVISAEELAAKTTPAAPVADEQLEYSIALAGLPVGRASFTTRREGDEFALEAEGGTNRVVDLFYAVRGVARSRVDEALASRTFYLEVDEDGKTSERALTYRATPCLYYRPWNDDPWVAILAQFRDPIDPLALLMKLRRLDPDREPHDFEVAMTMRSFCYRARCVARREVEVPAGDFVDAWIWRVEVRPYDKLGAKPDEPAEIGPILGFYEVAISADAHRLPLQIAREFGFGRVALSLRSVGTPAAVAATGSTATDGSNE